jgi:peptide/nickel transport system substrate-binding protein
MQRNPKRQAAACAAALGLALTWAAPANATTTLRIGLLADADNLDPTIPRGWSTSVVLNAVCDKLIDVTPDLRYVPQLATEWSFSDDGKALTLKLRQGVKFHDGEPLDAAAVKFSLDRHRLMRGSYFTAALASITSVDVVDGMTVRINMSEPTPGPLFSRFAFTAGMIMSPKAVQAAGDKFGLKPVCAGPYRFVERVANNHLTLERFPDYWDKSRVHVDRIVYRVIPDNSVRLANLRSGVLDLVEQMAPPDLAGLAGDARFKIAATKSLGYMRIFLNVGKSDRANTPLGRDRRIRQAFNLAIDRNVLSEVAFNGEYPPANSWISPASPFYLKNIPPTLRNLAKAKTLLAEAGEPRPNVEFTVSNTPVSNQIGQLIQAMAGEAGFQVKLMALESATALHAADKGNFEAIMFGYPGFVDPDANIYSMMACRAPLNYSGYCNAEVDRLLNAARASSDTQERITLYTRAREILAEDEDEPYLFLYHHNWIWVHSARLKGFVAHPDGITRVLDLRLD